MSGLCATEAFSPHKEIPSEAILEFINACAAPKVPATHPRANDSSFKEDHLRPWVERVDRYLIITPAPADERLPRSLDVLRSLQETVEDLSVFNQESAFPSYADPLSLEELWKCADELFPGYNQPPGVLPPAAASPPVDWWTPLPDYASPSPTNNYERNDEGSGAARLTPSPVDIIRRPAQDAPLLDNHNPAGQVTSNDQTASAVEPGTPAVAIPEVTMPTDSHTSGESSPATDPSISPATSPHAQEVPLPKPDVQGPQGPAVDEFAAAVELNNCTVAAPGVATPNDNGALPICPSDADPSTGPATPSVQEAALPDHRAQASPASANDSSAPAVEQSATANATVNAGTPEDTSSSRFFGAGSFTAPAPPAPAQEALLPVHNPQPTQEESHDQPAAPRKRGRPPKIPAPPKGQHSFIMYDHPVPGPSTFPVAAQSVSQALGNGASMSVYRDTLRDAIQYDPQDVARKAEAKAAKKSSGQ